MFNVPVRRVKMKRIHVLKVAVVVFLSFECCSNLRVIPERVFIDVINKTYIDNVKCNVRRYGRKSGYYLNAEGTIKHTWGNNISVDVKLYEFLHNEYRPTFIEFHFERGCEFLDKDPYMGRSINMAFQRSGITCPVKPGHYVLTNMTLQDDAFPYLWPFQRAMAVGTVTCGKNFIGNGSIYITFEQKKRH